jgi:hypothetical protein
MFVFSAMMGVGDLTDGRTTPLSYWQRLQVLFVEG